MFPDPFPPGPRPILPGGSKTGRTTAFCWPRCRSSGLSPCATRSCSTTRVRSRVRLLKVGSRISHEKPTMIHTWNIDADVWIGSLPMFSGMLCAPQGRRLVSRNSLVNDQRSPTALPVFLLPWVTGGGFFATGGGVNWWFSMPLATKKFGLCAWAHAKLADTLSPVVSVPLGLLTLFQAKSSPGLCLGLSRWAWENKTPRCLRCSARASVHVVAAAACEANTLRALL